MIYICIFIFKQIRILLLLSCMYKHKLNHQVVDEPRGSYTHKATCTAPALYESCSTARPQRRAGRGTKKHEVPHKAAKQPLSLWMLRGVGGASRSFALLVFQIASLQAYSRQVLVLELVRRKWEGNAHTKNKSNTSSVRLQYLSRHK